MARIQIHDLAVERTLGKEELKGVRGGWWWNQPVRFTYNNWFGGNFLAGNFGSGLAGNSGCGLIGNAGSAFSWR
ncbi:MAG: hypothetical protein HY548_00400 [Elusimicrobia bacterium]|nr:hypothetical protein [Elusimicrobiota bacterium]